MEFEEELWWGLAAQWWNVGWDKFAQLDGGMQSWMVAVYESQQQIESVLGEAALRKT